MQAWASYPGNQITLAVRHLGSLKIRRHAGLAGTAEREFKSQIPETHACPVADGPRYPHSSGASTLGLRVTDTGTKSCLGAPVDSTGEREEEGQEGLRGNTPSEVLLCQAG